MSAAGPALLAGLVAGLLVAAAALLLSARTPLRRARHPARPGAPDRPPPLDAALVLDLVAAVVEAGAAPPAAVAAVARVLEEAGSPVAGHLSSSRAPWSLQDPADDGPAAPAGAARPDRRTAGAVEALLRPLARCLQLAEQTGAPVAVLLRSSADELRRRRRRAAALAAARLGVRVVAPLGLCTLPAFAALAVVPVLISLGRDLLTG